MSHEPIDCMIAASPDMRRPWIWPSARAVGAAAALAVVTVVAGACGRASDASDKPGAIRVGIVFDGGKDDR